MPRLHAPIVLALACLVLAAAPLWAGGRDDFKFPPSNPRDPVEPEPPTAGPTDPGPSSAPVDDVIERDIRGLSDWPSGRGVRAAESLLLRGPDVIPRLVDVLVQENHRSQPGAAWVLGRVGEPVHVVAILRAAARRRNGSRAEVFFESAFDLEPQKTKDWLFAFLPLRRPVFRQKATDFLVDHIGSEDRVRVLRLLDAPKAGVRVAGLRLLDAAKIENVDDVLVESLSDLDPDVARTAGVLLAVRADETLVKRLNKLSREGLPRERAYAVLALTEMARARGSSPYERNTLVELAGRRGLLHPEKLLRGTAAIGLAFGALEGSDERLRDLLDKTVVDVLIDTVGGEHFRDYNTLIEPVFAALRRLSGLDLPTTAVAWASWWRTQRGRFKARRPLLKVTQEDMPFAYVRFEAVAADGGRRRVTFRSEDGSPQEGEFALRRDAFRALVDALESDGLFEEEATDKPRADEHVLVTLGVLNQKRGMVVPFSDDRYTLLRMRMDSLEEANLWQSYRDTDQAANTATWWEKNAELFAEADPTSRVAMLKTAIVYAFDDLPSDAARTKALDRLEDLQGQDEAAGSLTASESRALVQAAAASLTFGAIEERAVEFALRQDASSEVRKDLIEALAERSEDSARVLLSRLLAEGGAFEIRQAFADARPGMRGAAADAASTLLSVRDLEPAERAALAEAVRPGLEVLVNDADARVAIRSIVALDRVGAEGGIDRLKALYEAGNIGVKVAVADALGDMPAQAAFPLISLLLAEERQAGGAAVRAAALGSLARMGHSRAIGLLTYYLLNDSDASVQVAAGEALVDLNSDEARFGLIRALTEGRPDARLRARLVSVLGRFRGDVVREILLPYLEDEEPRVAEITALRLADQNVAATVPYLVAIARGKDPGAAQEAIRALENVSCVRFDVEGHELLAEQYEKWYQTARISSAREPDRAWLREALRRRGYDVGPLTPYVSEQSDPVAVPVLVRALRDEDAVIRRGAGIALGRVTGLSMGPVERSTSLRDAGLIADKWARWWERVQGPGDGPR